MTTPPSRTEARLLLVGDGLSAFATWVDFLAILSLAAFTYHVTSYEMGLVSAAALLPGILLGRRIGRLCDGQHTKALLLASIIGRVACTAGILLLGRFEVFLLFVGLRSIFATTSPVAINVLTLRCVATDQVPRYLSLLNVLNSSAKVLAPAIGTVSSSLSSESTVLLASALFSALSLACFAGLRPQPQPSDAAMGPAGKAAAAAPGDAGSMFPLLWLGTSYALYAFMVNNLVPVVLERAALDKALLGILVSAAGAGNILSGLVVARRQKKQPLKGCTPELTTPALLHALGFAAIGVAFLFRQWPLTTILPLLFFVIGTIGTRFTIGLNVFLARNHAAHIGTASGTLQSYQNAMILIAPLLGAMVLERAGPAALFFAAAGLAITLFGSFAVFHAAASASRPHDAARELSEKGG